MIPHQTIRIEIEAYAKRVREAVDAGMSFPEPPRGLENIRNQAFRTYKEWCRLEDLNVQSGPKLKVLKCQSCGAALTRRKCAYCGTAHVAA